jgi:hypothetical protein
MKAALRYELSNLEQILVVPEAGEAVLTVLEAHIVGKRNDLVMQSPRTLSQTLDVGPIACEKANVVVEPITDVAEVVHIEFITDMAKAVDVEEVLDEEDLAGAGTTAPGMTGGLFRPKSAARGTNPVF